MSTHGSFCLHPHLETLSPLLLLLFISHMLLSSLCLVLLTHLLDLISHRILCDIKGERRLKGKTSTDGIMCCQVAEEGRQYMETLLLR